MKRRRILVLVFVLGVAVSLMPRGSSATVEEQRARLPPPAECPDRVEGTWKALVWMAYQHYWYEYTVVIKRSAPPKDGGIAGPLEGEMISHYWSGDAKQDKPPACSPGVRELTVKMPGKGSVDDKMNVDFGANSYTVDNIACGSRGGYLPDHFTGKIDPAIQEFQSVNNDGGSAVNEPAVFRRIRCLNAPEGPSRKDTQAKPPSFGPPKKGFWSCGK